MLTAPPKEVSSVESVVSLNGPPMVDRKSIPAPEVRTVSAPRMTGDRKTMPPVVSMEPPLMLTFAAVASMEATSTVPPKVVSKEEAVVRACGPVRVFSKESAPAELVISVAAPRATSWP